MRKHVLAALIVMSFVALPLPAEAGPIGFLVRKTAQAGKVAGTSAAKGVATVARGVVAAVRAAY